MKKSGSFDSDRACNRPKAGLLLDARSSLRMTLSILVLLMLPSAASAQELSGTVKNGTTGKPAAHDDVVLLRLSQGMQEGARTKTDAQGHFTFKLDDGGPHLVRVNHQNVNYFRMAPPGTSSIEVEVYDAAKKVEGITGTVNVMRLQSDGSALQGIELYAVKNSSSPARTLMNDRPFAFYLPPGAQVDQAAAESPGGNPVNVAAVPDKDGRHYIVFPIRPGETQFQISYHLPYSGQAKIEPRFLMPYEHMAVVLPPSMQFTAETPGSYSPMSDQGSTVQVATNVTPGKPLAFRVSGTGTLSEESASAQQQPQSGGTAQNAMPGGGLGTPIDTPDPLYKYRWPVLGGLLAVLVAGGVYIVTRPRPAAAATGMAAPPVNGQVPAPSRSATLLDALKEELFQLEVDRQQGRISPEEYEKAKAALDTTIRRAIARKS